MIAKAIVELFNLLPGSSRSTATSSEQPMQAFSDSLLAASKSFLQVSSTGDASSKTGRQQQSTSGDSKTTAAVIDGDAVLSPNASQKNSKFNVGVTTLQTLLLGLTVTKARSTGLTRLVSQSPSGNEQSASQSTDQTGVSQTGIAQADIVSKTLVLAAGYQSKFATAQKPFAGLATAQSGSTTAISQPVQDATATGSLTTQSSVTQSDNAQQVVVQSVFTSSHVQLAQPATAQRKYNGVTRSKGGKVSPTGSTNNPSSVSQAKTIQAKTSQASVVSSNATPMEMPVAKSEATQTTLVDATIPVMGNTFSTGWAETLSIIAQSSTARTSTPQASAVQPIVTQSNIASVQPNSVAPATTLNTSTDATSQFAPVAPTSKWNQSESSFASAGASKPARLQSSVAPVQMPLAGSVASTAAASQSSRNLSSVGSRQTQSFSTLANITSESLSQSPVVQSNVASLQTTAAVQATAQEASTDAANQSTWNTPSVSVAKTQSTQSVASLASIISASIPQSAAVASYIAPVEAVVTKPTTARNVATGQTIQAPRNFASTKLASDQSSLDPMSFVQPSTSQPSSAESKAAVAPASLIAPVTTGNAPTVAANHDTWTMHLAGLNDAETSSTRVPQPVMVQPDSTQGQMSIAAPVNQNPPTVAVNQTREIVTASKQPEIESIAIQTNAVPASTSQPDVDQLSVAPAQMPVAVSSATQNISSGPFNHAAQTVTAAASSETETSVADIAAFPTAARQTSILQPDVDQSSDAPAQIPVAVSPVTRNASTVAFNQPAQIKTAAASSETETLVPDTTAVPTGIRQARISQPVADQSSVATAKTPFAATTMSQNDSTVMTNQPALATITATPTETETINAETSAVPTGVRQARIFQPVADQSSAATAMTPLAATTTSQNDSSVVTNQPALATTTATPSETETVNAETSAVPTGVRQARISQPVADQSSVATAKTPFAATTTSQNDSTIVTNQPALATTTATETINAETSFVPSDVRQANIPQRIVDQPNVTRAQMPVEIPAGVQDVSTPSQSTQVVSTKEEKTLPNSTQPSVAQETLAEPVSIQSDLTQLNQHDSQSSSKLPAATIQEVTPIIASSKSGNDDPSAVAAAVPNPPLATEDSGMRDSLTGTILNAIPNAIQNSVANDSIETIAVAASSPVPSSTRLASAKDAVAPALKSDSIGQAQPQPAAADASSTASAISVSGSAADQTMFLLPFDESFGAIQTVASSLKQVSTAKSQGSAVAGNKASSQAELKKNSEPGPETGSKANSQDAPSSGNQSQGGIASQAQIVAATPVNNPGHSAAAITPAQSTATAAPAHTSSTPSGTADVAAKTTDNSAAHVSTALPQAQPVINTAKLVQNMGQSEMRVGMRSNEFGNISINTSSNRDVVSAQISVEHGELAKTLVAHLPEMQARLGGNQPADVRIDMNGAATGQGTGNFGGMSNDSPGQSRSGRQPAGNMAAGQSGNGVAEPQFSPVVATVPSGYARLDIRV